MLSRGVTGSTLVLLGSLPVVLLETTTQGRMAALVVVLLGLALLGSAWLQLCAEVAAGAAGLRKVHVAAALWSLPLLPAPPLFSNDGWSYAAQGALTLRGLSPYDWTPALLSGPLADAVDPAWLHTPAPYGPLTLQLGGLFADVTHDPWLLVVLHRSLALLGLALLAWALPRLAAWSGRSAALTSAMVLPSPIVLAHGVGGLHNDLLLAGSIAVALVVARDVGWAWGAVLVGLATAVKAPGILVGIGVVLVTLPASAALATRLRRGTEVASVAGAVVLATGLPHGLGLGWVHALGVPGSVTPLSLTSVLGSALDAQPQARALGLVLAGAAALALALLTPTGSPTSALRATALALGAVLVLGPVLHLWYLLWVLPLMAAMRCGGPRPTGLLVAVCLAGGLAAPIDSSLHGLYLVVVVGTALAVALVGLLLVLQPRPARTALVPGRLDP